VSWAKYGHRSWDVKILLGQFISRFEYIVFSELSEGESFYFQHVLTSVCVENSIAIPYQYSVQ